jgi:hypothetical protein
MDRLAAALFAVNGDSRAFAAMSAPLYCEVEDG